MWAGATHRAGVRPAEPEEVGTCPRGSPPPGLPALGVPRLLGSPPPGLPAPPGSPPSGLPTLGAPHPGLQAGLVRTVRGCCPVGKIHSSPRHGRISVFSPNILCFSTVRNRLPLNPWKHDPESLYLTEIKQLDRGVETRDPRNR